MSLAKFSDCAGILFDFGGTLDSDGEHWLDRFFALYRQESIDFPEDVIKRAFYRAVSLCEADSRVNSWGLRSLMRHHVGLQFTELGLEEPGKRDRMIDTFCSKSERFLRRNAQLLQRVRERFRLGLVSNFYGNVATICEEAGLSPSLDVVIDSARLGKKKPDPEIYLAALHALGLSPEQAVFVGDSYDRDMMPARRLGMKTIWLKGPNPRIPANADPVDACITSLAELESLVP